MQATRGAVVSLTYTLRDDDGLIIDTNEGCDPLVYLHGYDNLISGLEQAVEGMSAGETSTVVVEPADAYGEFNQEAVFDIPRGEFPEGMPLEPGLQLTAETPSGEVYMVVVEVGEDSVTVDANHPLAGKRLHFDIEVVDVRPASNEELLRGYPDRPLD
jgi:FKBP-type peptidyl-prolyl cis-trans isomerase SlyD